MKDTNSILAQIESLTKELSIKLRSWEDNPSVSVRNEGDAYVISIGYDNLGRISQYENGDWFADCNPIYGVGMSCSCPTLEYAITVLIKRCFGLQ